MPTKMPASPSAAFGSSLALAPDPPEPALASALPPRPGPLRVPPAAPDDELPPELVAPLPAAATSSSNASSAEQPAPRASKADMPTTRLRSSADRCPQGSVRERGSLRITPIIYGSGAPRQEERHR